MKKIKPNNLNTIIGKGTKVVGEIYTNGSIRIDGEVEGKIESKGFLTVGPTAKIKADIKAKEGVIAGIIHGNINVENSLILQKSSQIRGDVIAKVLDIEKGAKFDGKCQMESEIIENIPSEK
ncbi:MAG: polymer-forming cytoskeletal protein [Candidatus Cloacimonetes bacterium]|nr:polymer-forming cytoskeletal protein [Candidatus Cloacimonadota bacterium]